MQKTSLTIYSIIISIITTITALVILSTFAVPADAAAINVNLETRKTAAVVEGDSYHRYDRNEMKQKMADEGLSHFGTQANRFDKLEELFKTYGETGGGQKRYYLHSPEEADEHNARLGTDLMPGQFTPWEDLPAGTWVNENRLSRKLSGFTNTVPGASQC